jgi:hypothetical protein
LGQKLLLPLSRAVAAEWQVAEAHFHNDITTSDLDLIAAAQNPISILVLLLLFQFHSPDGIIIVMYYFNSFLC